MNLKEIEILELLKRKMCLFDIAIVKEIEALAAEEQEYRRRQAEIEAKRS